MDGGRADAANPPDDRIVVPLRLPLRYAILIPGLPILFVGGDWWAEGRSVLTFVATPLLIVFLLWWWATRLAFRRAGGGGPRELVLTTRGVSSPVWSLDWDNVERITIGQPGRTRALAVRPSQWSDIRWAPARVVRLNAWLGGRIKGRAIPIFEVNLDRSVFDLAQQIERKAGRTLFADTRPRARG